MKLILPPSIRAWVTDGTRTRDVQDHNLALYQLSYGYRREIGRAVIRADVASVNADDEQTLIK